MGTVYVDSDGVGEAAAVRRWGGGYATRITVRLCIYRLGGQGVILLFLRWLLGEG